MTCSRFTQSMATACRDSKPGVSYIYLANYLDVTGFDVDAAGTSITGITMSGSTKFYPIKLNKEVGSFIDTASINIPNGTAISRPKLSFKVQGLNTTTIAMYKELLQADVIAVVKGIDGTLYGVGFSNGLSMTVGTLGSEATADGFAGLTIELDGIESAPFYIIGNNVDFDALVA